MLQSMQHLIWRQSWLLLPDLFRQNAFLVILLLLPYCPARKNLRKISQKRFPVTIFAMIRLTRLNNKTIYLNPDLIKCIEETPDTIITLINDDKYLVMEKASEIIDKIIVFRVTVLKRSEKSGKIDDSEPFSEDE